MVRGYCYDPLARPSRSEFAGKLTFIAVVKGIDLYAIMEK